MCVIQRMFLLISLGMLFFAFSASASTVDVPNNSFEDGEERPLPWTTYHSPNTNAVFAWDKTVAHTGKRSVYIKSDGPATACWRTDVPVRSGATYGVKVWVKIQNGVGKTVLTGRFRKKNKLMAFAPATRGLSGNVDWTQISLEFTVPEEITGISIFLTNKGGAGDEVWFDDVEMEKTGME